LYSLYLSPSIATNQELIALATEAVPPRWVKVEEADPVFDALFIQPDRGAGWGDPERRRADLGRAAAAGVRTIIVQYLAHGDDSLLGPGPGGSDETMELLDDAGRLGMDVWLGTREDPAIWEELEVPVGVWAAAADGGIAIAEEIAARYSTHPAFTGWYWTPEVVWATEPDAARLRSLTKITRRAVRALHKLADKPVAIVLGPSNRGWESIHGGAWCRYVDGSKAERLVVMDGVGTAHLDVAHLGRLYGTLRGCAERVGFELMADVELFGPGGLPPAPTRLHRQLSATLLFPHRRGAFDLGHYLAPGGEGARFWAAPGAAAELIKVEQSERDRRGARVEVAAPVHRVDITTQPPHPEAVELYAILDRGDAQYLGEPAQTHGPGRYQRTWIWRPPPGSEPVRTFEVVLRSEHEPGEWALIARGE
jgi:hypothetical protein